MGEAGESAADQAADGAGVADGEDSAGVNVIRIVPNGEGRR
jgi:hypothetical protein